MANVNFKMNDQLKADFETVCEGMGLTVSAVLNLCAKQIVREQGLPFRVTAKSNAETIEAMREAKAIAADEKVRSFRNTEELRKELGV